MTLLMISPVAATPDSPASARTRAGEALGQASLRGLAALLLPVLRAAARPVESVADYAADEGDAALAGEPSA